MNGEVTFSFGEQPAKVFAQLFLDWIIAVAMPGPYVVSSIRDPFVFQKGRVISPGENGILHNDRVRNSGTRFAQRLE